MNKADIELIREGLQATDPTELVDLVYNYCEDAKHNMDVASEMARMMLIHKTPDEEKLKKIRAKFKKASESMLDAAEIFEPGCMLDLLNCED